MKIYLKLSPNSNFFQKIIQAIAWITQQSTRSVNRIVMVSISFYVTNTKILVI